MKILPYIVFSFLMLCALCTGINSYHRTEYMIAQDVNQALKQVLLKMPDNVVTTDTIRCYRNCLTIAELKIRQVSPCVPYAEVDVGKQSWWQKQIATLLRLS